MTPNDDLARWGEPPASEAELALAEELAEVLAEPLEGPAARMRGLPDPADSLLETSAWIEQMIGTLLTHAGLFENPPAPADAGGPVVDLRLRVLRQAGAQRFEPVASTHPRPTVLRDLRRIPHDPDRVTLRTGDRVRLEVCCDHDGCLTVFNVGPAGALNLLHPETDAQAAPLRAGTPLLIGDVEMTPPAGRERLYAVWSRTPLPASQLSWLARPGVATRDMQRVQETLSKLRAEDWHAVMLELEHRA
jgi:hypothetical protein